MGATGIDYCDKAWNPIVGCTPAPVGGYSSKVQAGCYHCWARALHDMRHKAFLAGKKMPPQYAKPFNEVQLLPERLDEPLHWRKPQMIAVAFQADLFHKDVPDEFIDKTLAVIASNARHTFLVLTKRPDRMATYFERVNERGKKHANLYTSGLIDFYSRHGVDLSVPYQVPGPPTPELRFIYDSANGIDPKSRIEDRPRSAFGETHWRKWPLSNLWLGISASTQSDYDKNVSYLLRYQAAVRFVSLEPLLENITLDLDKGWTPNILLQGSECDPSQYIGWIVAGCESGPRRRRVSLDAFRSLRDQCVAAGVPYFFKQAEIDGRLVKMPALDGKVWAEYPMTGRES